MLLATHSKRRADAAAAHRVRLRVLTPVVVGIGATLSISISCLLDSYSSHLAATIGASRNDPALRTLAPVRPPHAKACPHCKEFRVSPSGAEGCPMCWYLGWVPPNPPPWFLRSDSA